MIKRKLVIYQNGSNSKPIVLSDTSDSTDEQLKEELKKLFLDDKITVLDTDDDFLILRPGDISAILVSKEKEKKEEFHKPDLLIETSTTNKKTTSSKKSSNKYVESLDIKET